MRKLLPLIFPCCLLFSSLYPVKKGSEEEIGQQLRKILSIEKQLSEELTRLKNMFFLSPDIQELVPLESRETMTLTSREATKKGIAFFQEKEWSKAKEEMQKAWESDPEEAITHFNLGLIYYHLGHFSLAKNFFHSALKINPDIPRAKQLSEFLQDSSSEEKESEELQRLRTQLINMNNQLQSYLQSKTLDRSKKMRLMIETIQKMEKIIGNHSPLIRDYCFSLSEYYLLFEWYDHAVRLLQKYEEGMEGEVLPEKYHAKKLELEDGQKRQLLELQKYVNNTIDEKAATVLEKNRAELEIFAVQFDQFVSSTEREDPDFSKITKRLKEFRWGNKSGRHVLIINPYQEILFSSLPQPLPLERYQEHQTKRPFFKEITLLKNQLKLKQVEFVSLNLSLREEVVNYVLLYTYVPKHDIFIIVKIPYRDLAV